MTVFEQIKNNLQSLDVNRILRTLLSDQKVKDYIIKLNTRDQLFKKGENSLGQDLDSIGGSYSPFTIEIKKDKGLPFDKVTLFDTGDFYDSFTVTIGSDYFQIDANPIKEETNLFEDWGEEIVGLNQENLQKIIDSLRNEISREVFKELRKGL